MKGIVLAGGKGTRMHPLTKSISKQLLGVYDKPAIYYPLSILMLADIQDIAIIVNPHEKESFKKLLGNGEDYGLKLTYLTQDEPRGIADAFNVAEDFLNNDSSMLILGDNFFYGFDLPKRLRKAKEESKGCTVFAMQVKDPSSFGVLEIDEENMKPISLVEKPENPPSNWAVTGLYIFDEKAPKLVKNQLPSKRGELEIVELINQYLNQKKLDVEFLGRGTAWLDSGTPNGMLSCATFVKTVEDRQGFKIACLEEIAYRRRFLPKEKVLQNVEAYPNSPYKDYILDVLSRPLYNM